MFSILRCKITFFFGHMQIFLYLCSEFVGMNAKILIIDGDISLSTVLSDYFCSRGYASEAVSSGKEGLDFLSATYADLVLMEIQGVGMNGYDLLREIHHRYSELPIIILTTRTDRESQMRAFQLGCDDYQFKPFSMDILIYRIEAILRRVKKQNESKQRVFNLNGHTFDATHQTFDGEHLSGRESDLLLMLCRNEDEVVDRHRILASLWKEDNAFTSRSMGVYINHLRRFVERAGYSIAAVRGKGYKLVFNESK